MTQLLVPAGHPIHRLAGAPVDGGERERREASRPQIGLQPFEGAVDPAEMMLEEPAQRLGVDEALLFRREARAAGGEPQPPAADLAGERERVGAQERVELHLEPDLCEPIGGGGEAPLVRGEEGGVDRSGRDAGENRHAKVWTPCGQEAQDADLVGGAGAAAGEDQREISAHAATLAKAGDWISSGE